MTCWFKAVLIRLSIARHGLFSVQAMQLWVALLSGEKVRVPMPRELLHRILGFDMLFLHYICPSIHHLKFCLSQRAIDPSL